MNAIRILLHEAFLVTTLLLTGSAIYNCAAEGEPHPNALTPERIAALPAQDCAAWQQYYERSQAHLNRDKAVLAAELKATGMDKPLPAPYPAPGGPRVPGSLQADWYQSADGRSFADAIVSFQTPSGAWSKGIGFNVGLRKPGMHWSAGIDGWYYVGTFDNGATTTQLVTLARAYQATQDPKYAAAFTRGLDYLFDAQYPNGGWPQNYPLVGWYHDNVTFNDDAMTHVVELLRDVAAAKADYTFVDETRRLKARTAAEAGLRCILQAQIKQRGQLTAWCAQHDPIDLTPAPARAFEVASVSGWESANVIKFLMSIERPNPEVKTAVESAIQWFGAVKVNGFEVVSSLNAVGGRVFALKANPGAGPLWARFYELDTNRPIFVTREAKVFYNLSDLDQSGPNRGYHWYVDQPRKLLEQDYPRWHAAWNQDKRTGTQVGLWEQ